ncbi:restriction endonuclease subunit S [uncultured Marinobacter sp.]|uniref:restriction endonuclease subunit S n=1 Tax=uncultured Marinobacter sp. TaxID=187379 RepID=UPI00260DEC0B|nr:restriction endonuclease subunit S [uncultured Marinobacter sp.]
MSDHYIPTGWKQAKISDISIKGLQRKPGTDESFIYVDIGSIDRSLKKISDPQVVAGDNAPSRARKVIESGDVLVSLTRPNLNAVALVDQKYHKQIASTGFEVIKPVLVDSRYIFALVRSKEFVDQISGVVQGALYPAAKSSDVQNFEFPLSPLAEQKVIADKLDTLLAQVENTKARLECIPKILKRFRQSVLAAAVSGRLTEEWRNLAGLPEWEAKVLGDVIGNIDQGWSPKCHNEPTSDESWGVIKTSSVLPMDFVENENKKLPYNLDAKPSLRLLDSDILTTRAGPRSRCGITCYVSEISKNLMICDKVYRYKVIEGKGSSKFLALQLNSPYVLEKIETLKTGISESGMNLTQKKFRQLELNWPTPEEQTEIVHRVDQLFAHADRIEQQVNNALARVNNLAQSILAKTFRGELTEQWRKDNPDLISGENSAEALLERIKAERASVAKPKHLKSKA